MRTLFILFSYGLLSMGYATEKQVFESSQQATTLIELYTSEGCSSCPPADQWLSRLKHSKKLWHDLIPIAFHVDYWDDLGWKDPYASRENSNRQLNYHLQNHLSSVYTPGFVVSGNEWRGFFSGKNLPDPHTTHHVGKLTVEIEADQLKINFSGKKQTLDFHIALLAFDLTNAIKSGENSGRLLKHDFVAIEHTTVESNTNEVLLTMPQLEEMRKNKRALVVWVNSKLSLKPIQAVGGPLSL